MKVGLGLRSLFFFLSYLLPYLEQGLGEIAKFFSTMEQDGRNYNYLTQYEL